MKNFSILLALALLLAGCSTAPAQESTVPGTSAPIAKPSTTSQTDPASLSGSAPSPEEYYASAESVESLMFQPSWHEANDVWVRAKGDALVLTHQRIPETVFEAPFGRLSGSIYWVHYCCYFMASVDAAADGIYRLYAPTGQVELLVGDIPIDRNNGLFFPVSNVEVTWDEMDPEYLDACLAVWDTERDDLRLSPESTESGTAAPRQCWGDGADFDIRKDRTLLEYVGFYHLVNAEMANRGYPEAYAAHSYYLNSLTGKTLTIQALGYYEDDYYSRTVHYFYPDGTERPEEMVAKNGRNWWLDDYYAD